MNQESLATPHRTFLLSLSSALLPSSEFIQGPSRLHQTPSHILGPRSAHNIPGEGTPTLSRIITSLPIWCLMSPGCGLPSDCLKPGLLSASTSRSLSAGESLFGTWLKGQCENLSLGLKVVVSSWIFYMVLVVESVTKTPFLPLKHLLPF